MPLVVVHADDDWNGSSRLLCEADATLRAPVFCAPHWLDAAWLWRQAEARKRYFVLGSDKSGVTGFAPLIKVEHPTAGVALRTIRWLTVPDTQFADICAAPGRAAQFAESLALHLQCTDRGWDRLQLTHLSNLFPNWKYFESELRRRNISCASEAIDENPFIDLSGSFDSYYADRSRSLKKAVNLSSNRLGKSGRIDVDWIKGGSSVHQSLADAIYVSAMSWKQQTGNTLDRAGPRAFVEALTDSAAELSQLSLWLLRLDGKVIATEYQIIADGNVYALRSDFDPTFSELSPGTFLSHHLLKSLFGQGLKRYYMGPGGNPYKRRWTDSSEPMFKLTAYSSSARGRLAYWLEHVVRPRFRPVRSKLDRSS
jgi:hypothetical protein